VLILLEVGKRQAIANEDDLCWAVMKVLQQDWQLLTPIRILGRRQRRLRLCSVELMEDGVTARREEYVVVPWIDCTMDR
jgi:hypothetical protein